MEIEGRKGGIMGWIGDTVDSIKSIKPRQLLTQTITLVNPQWLLFYRKHGTWLSKRDILFLRMSKEPIRVGEIVVFSIEGRDIPIVHRAIIVHERANTGEVDVLTKGDNNDVDDIGLYAKYQETVMNEIESYVKSYISQRYHCSLVNEIEFCVLINIVC